MRSYLSRLLALPPRCNDHVPEAIYWELPDRIRGQVEIDATRPPAPASNRKKRDADDEDKEE